jgi:pyruvate kinase
MRRTKIICTLGPASCDPGVIEALVAAGMDVARLNFSHGEHAEHRRVFERVRAAAARAGREVAILQDLQGPKIRVGRLTGGRMHLRTGGRVLLAPGDEQPGPDTIPTSYESLSADVRPGDRILLDDGLLRLRVISTDGASAPNGPRVECRVEVGGELRDRKGINLPGVDISAPALTSKDRKDLAFGAELGVDLVSLSFVRRPHDVVTARRLLREAGSTAPLIAKIEKPEAVEALGDILEEADGIMVARGDLGVELGPEKVPLIQKEAIEQANRRGKLVITATQMLESMIAHAFPTRAEASDVANAVLDQSDAVMLSGETAVGAHPVLAVQTMAGIVQEVESSARYGRSHDHLPPVELGLSTNAVAHAAVTAAGHVSARAIVCVSGHGGSPRLVSDYRPPIPIVALTRYPEIAHRLAAWWGVSPLLFQRSSELEETLARIDALLRERELAEPGDTVIVTCVVPVESGEHTNTLKVHRVSPPPAG